jgi:hypothetical protein
LRRAQLDTALGLRVNYLTASVGPCCVACAGTVVASNLLPRLAGVCGCGALALALVPWAFGTSLAGLDGESAGGGGRIQATALAAAAWLAAMAAGASAAAAARAALLADAHGSPWPGAATRRGGGDALPAGSSLAVARGAWPVLVRAFAGRAGVAAAKLGCDSREVAE